jgi:RHS repeat-associated protein
VYGSLTSHTGTSTTPFLYNGRDGVVTDSDGLYYMKARYYSPTLMRFVNADTLTGSITASETLNRYAYANGNPISLIDPFGHSAEIYKNICRGLEITGCVGLMALTVASIILSGGIDSEVAIPALLAELGLLGVVDENVVCDEIELASETSSEMTAKEVSTATEVAEEETANVAEGTVNADWTANESGYFGISGPSSNSSIRNLSGRNEAAQEFYEQYTKGYVSETDIGVGTYRKLSDGTTITYRSSSSSDGTPAIDINDSPVYPNQKIHFID